MFRFLNIRPTRRLNQNIGAHVVIFPTLRHAHLSSSVTVCHWTMVSVGHRILLARYRCFDRTLFTRNTPSISLIACRRRSDRVAAVSPNVVTQNQRNDSKTASESNSQTAYTSKYGINDLTFEDCQLAYKSKKTSELLRALFVLKMCSYGVFVERSLQVSF